MNGSILSRLREAYAKSLRLRLKNSKAARHPTEWILLS